MYSKRTQYIESLIYSGKVTDEEKKLLQNGYIPENYLADLETFTEKSEDSNIEPLIFGNYFNTHPEKVSGTIIPGSGYINPVKVKGDIDSSIKAIKTMKRNTNQGYKGMAKVAREANKKLKPMQPKPLFNKGDIVEDSKSKAKILRYSKPKIDTPFYAIENFLYDIEREGGAKAINMPESRFKLLSTASEQELMRSQINLTGNMANAVSKPEPENKQEDWLFIGKFPTGTQYADKTVEKDGDYLKIAYVFDNPDPNTGEVLKIQNSDSKYNKLIDDLKAKYSKKSNADFLKSHIVFATMPKIESENKTCKTCDNKVTPPKDVLSAEAEKETFNTDTVPSVIEGAEVILENKDNSPEGDKVYYTVEESVKFLNPGISDDELKAWVWYKRLHGNQMLGWEKWFIDSGSDSKTKIVYAAEETELLGNNYKPIGFVPKGSIIGLKTKFSNTYGEITYIVCKTQQGSLVWVNNSHVIEKDTVNASKTSELDRLAKEGALVFTGDEYLPIPIFLFGNYYAKIKELEANKQAIIDKFGDELYENTIAILEKYKPKQKSFGDPVSSRRPFVSVLSEFATNPEIFSIRQLNEELNIRLGEYKRNRFRELEENITLYDAFQFYLEQYVKDTDIKKTSKSNIKTYYFAKAIKWPKDNDKKDLLSESQKAELVGNARSEAERLFSEFLANGLLIEDRMKLDYEWNTRYNAMSNVNNFVHKVPIGYEGSAKFKAGKLIIKPAQREGLAYLSIVGSGCLAYEVGFGKTAIGILHLASLMSQGKIKRPLIIVPKPTYKNWLKEIFGYYSDGERNDLYPFDGAKYYYGILSGTKIKLNDWYNLKGKTLQRLLAEYGSSEAVNTLIPENTITVVTYQGFEQIGFSHDVSEKVFDSIYEALAQKEAMDEESRDEAKEYQKIRELMGIAQKDTIFDIDKLGFDHITIDEAHNFKNAFSSCGKDPATKRKLFGISANRSNRAVKMFFHTQYIQRFYGKNVVMFTATPFTNSPLEWFSMLSYIGLDSLLNYNLWNIQKFFEQFVIETVEYSVDAKGELRVKPVIKSIQNLGLFQTILFNHFHRKDDPKEAGITRPCLYEIPNKDISTHLDMNEYQMINQSNVKTLVESYSKDNKGAILKALSLSQNNAFSPFLASREYPMDAEDFIEKSPKLKYICECIRSVKEYHESREEECSGQIIYSNRGVEYFEYIKEYLQDNVGFKTGLIFDDEKVDEVEILTGGGSEKDEDWKELVKEAFNAGIVKVIIGTSTIKEGVNLQTRGTAIYLALPEYNPSDIQQLKGRIWRQGNMYGYCRFVVPLVVNSMDAFIWQKIDEKTARLGSIWVKTESNTSEMQSELSPEEIKYSLVESIEEKFKIKKDTEDSKAQYDFKLAEENLKIIDTVNYEVSELKSNINKAKSRLLDKIPSWLRLLDVITKKILPEIEKADTDDKAKVKKYFNDLRDKINDLITQFNICKDSDWNQPREILTLIRYLQQRNYDLPSQWSPGLLGQVSHYITSENFDWRLFGFDSYIKNKITEHWSTIAKAERSVFQPYGKSWVDDMEDLRETFKKSFNESKLYLEYLGGEEFKTELINKIKKEIETAQTLRGSVLDRVEQFKTTNHLLSYLKDNTDLENCPIPSEPCCDMNIIDATENPDTYNETIVFEAEMPRIVAQNETKAVSDELNLIQEYQDIIFTYKEMLNEILSPGERQEYEDIIFTYQELLNDLKIVESDSNIPTGMLYDEVLKVWLAGHAENARIISQIKDLKKELVTLESKKYKILNVDKIFELKEKIDSLETERLQHLIRVYDAAGGKHIIFDSVGNKYNTVDLQNEWLNKYYKNGEFIGNRRSEPLKLSDIPDIVKTFMPLMQQKAIVGSTEHWDTIHTLESIITKMPETYGTEDIPTNEKIVYLHYFYGSSDWYIVEKDSTKEQLQAFGYTVLNGDLEMAEWGYVNIEELKDTNKIELDFYWEPKQFQSINL